ncbi:ABC-three component system middle component 1 [unidentified bacterial endosymbiont]|uniref:ABC-three component system middle component 1 n=1 Tax=unidentified bacterial endosymbiont TaxID=2355 RepID=UPI00209D96EA|nr:ABC-three component system middle component 1 [unidentified bacterial endosymbiont]
MIKQLINEALLAHDFVSKLDMDNTSFYIRESGSAIRFAVLHNLDDLLDPAELNNRINQLAPDEFLRNPSFKKNCDLICIHRLDVLARFKDHEEEIFAIEEDPHFYKKYVLYYSVAEESVLANFTYDKLLTVIADQKEFLEYKENPLVATQYSFAAKTFIKLPFLELPSHQGNLVSLRLQAAEAVAETDLNDIYSTIQQVTDKNAGDFIKEMIRNEMANIQD